MKLAYLAILLLIAGCTVQHPVTPAITISSVVDLELTDAELQELGMTGSCQPVEEYSNVVDSTLGEYAFCNYTISNTEMIIELKRFTNKEALNGSYQYDSSHYYSAEGLLGENQYGDQSRFRVNSEKDYGGEFNPPGVYFYHLWFTKDSYLIHITSKGSEDAKDTIAEIGRMMLSRFG